MNFYFHRAADAILRRTGLQFFPVRVRGQLATGARWTLYPASAYWRGTHEPSVGAALLSLGDLTGKCCWDLGAHYGYYSVALAMLTGPTGQVVAVEPFAANFARLERHRKMNELSWVKTFECAASNTSGTADFFTDLSDGDTAVHLAYEGEVRTLTTRTTSVRTVRMDDLVERLEIRPPDFIKVDVEGHGHHALGGANESIRRSRPVILMGFHSPQEVAGTKSILDPLGYRWEPLDPNPPTNCVGCDFILRPSN